MRSAPSGHRPATLSPGAPWIRSARPDSAMIFRATATTDGWSTTVADTPCRPGDLDREGPRASPEIEEPREPRQVVASREQVRGTRRARVLAPD